MIYIVFISIEFFPFSHFEGSVAAAQTTNSASNRVYDKKYYCMFCDNTYSKLPRHLVSQHQNEKEVIAYIQAKDAATKRKLLTRIRNLGSHQHNESVIRSGKGKLSVKYRPCKQKTEEDYAVCEHCFGYFSKRKLWQHVKSCELRVGKVEKHTRHIAKGKILMPSKSGCSEALHEILSVMVNDDVSRVVRSDRVILALGEKMLYKQGKQKKAYLRNTLRELGRLLLALRSKSTGLTALEDYMIPSMFKTVVAAVREVSGFCGDKVNYETPTLAIKLGQSLCKVARILKAEALTTGNKKQREDAEAFLELHRIDWNTEVSANAYQSLVDDRKNKPKRLPLSDDVRKLAVYLKTNIATLTAALEKETANRVLYKKLAKLVLSLLILFNRRRSGEVAAMTVRDFTLGDSAVLNSNDLELSPLEKALCHKFKRVEIRGKRGRTVPILFTQATGAALDLLIDCRPLVSIPADNDDVFQNPDGEGCLRGSDCLREASENCGAKHPDLLRSTKLRKHIATMTQIVNLEGNELDILAGFMGHDIRTHREFYRLPEETIQVAKVSKLLLLLESGQKLTGKTLSDIDVSELEEDFIEEETSCK